FPSIYTAKAAVIVVLKALEVIERDHFQIGLRKSRGQFLADGVEDANAGLFFDALGKGFFSACRLFLGRRLIPRAFGMHGTLLVPAHVKQRASIRTIDDNARLGLWALGLLLGLAVLSFVQDIAFRVLGLPRGSLGDAQGFLP